MEKEYLLILTFFYHALQDRPSRGESNLVTKKLKVSARKRLGKCLDELICGGYVSYSKESTLNLFTNEVIVKTNMLHMGVEYWRSIVPILSQNIIDY